MDATRASSKEAARAAEEPVRSSGPPVFNSRNVMMMVTLFATALLTLMVLQVLFKIPPFRQSAAPHYIYQAESFLHGRWDITPQRQTWDSIQLHGKLYLVYPPFPALVMLPFVALFGAHTSDVFITTLIASLNLPLLYLLLEQGRFNGLTARTPRENLLMSLLLYFGSINLYLSLGGEVWFTAHIICLACGLLSLLLALRRRFGWSAALLGCAFFTRGTMALGFPIILYLAWVNAGDGPRCERFFCRFLHRRAPASQADAFSSIPVWQEIPWRRLLPPVAVILGLVALFLLRNTIVFGSPLESGYSVQNQQHYPQITNGLFSFAYLPRNVLVNFLEFPRVTFASPYALAPSIDLIGNGIGMSVFVTTPLFLFLFVRNQRISPLRMALHVTIAVFVIETLLFCGTGSSQFGARYLFDAYPFAFLLLALNEWRMDWRFLMLGGFGLLINLVGAFQFWG